MSSTMTASKVTRTECPWCGQGVNLTSSGLMYRHRINGNSNYCYGSRLTPVQADRRVCWREFMRFHYHSGDALPVYGLMLKTNPPESLRDRVTYVSPDIPEGLTVDEELAFLVADARGYIARMGRLLLDGYWTP